MRTPAIDRIVNGLTAAAERDPSLRGYRNGGIYNRRKIRGSKTGRWSQHSWGNGWDIMVDSLELGDRIEAWLRANHEADIDLILWRRKNHWDHLHVTGSPRCKGVPPMIGEQRKQSDVRKLQKALLARGFRLPRFGADGLWGTETYDALAAMMARYDAQAAEIGRLSALVDRGHVATKPATTGENGAGS